MEKTREELVKEVQHLRRELQTKDVQLERMEKSERCCRAILDALAERLAVLDSEGTLVLVNKSWRDFVRKVTGDEDTDWIGVHYRYFEGVATDMDKDVHLFTDGIRSVLEGELPTFSIEYPRNTPLGDVWFEGRAYSTKRDCEAAVVISHADVTERKRAEMALRASEARFRAIFDRAPMGMAVIGMDLKPTQVNRTLLDSIGFSETEIGQTQVIMHSDPDDRATHLKLIGELVDGKIDQFSEVTQLIRKDGSTLWGRVTGSLVRGEEGNPDYFIATVEDVSERKKAEMLLMESEEKFSNIFQHSPNAMLLVDGQTMTILDVNRAYTEVFGFEREDVVNKEGRLGVASRATADVELVLQTIKKHDRISNFELEAAAKDGSSIFGVINVEPVDIHGRHLHIIMFVDLSERKRAEEALRISEDRVRSIIEHSTNLFFAHTVDHELTYLSPQCRDFLDCEPEEAKVRWLEFATDHPINKEGFKFTETAIATGKVQPPYELQLRGLKGREVWVEVNEAPVVVDGKTVGIVGSLTDITSRHEAEEHIRRYKTITDASSDLMSMVNPSYEYLAVNDVYRTYYGLQNEDLIGYTYADIVGEERFQKLIQPSLDLALSGQEVHFESSFDYPTMGKRFMSVRYHPVQDSNGRVSAVVATIRDVTERQELRERLIRADRMQALGTLAGGIAHDFNNLLAPILGYSEMAIESLSGETELEEDLREIQMAGTRAKELVDKILAFSRRTDVEMAPVDLKTVADEVLGLLRSAVPSSTEIKTAFTSDACVLGNSTELHQVMMNLCTNSLQAMGSDGGELSIELDDVTLDDVHYSHEMRGLMPGEYVRITVSDTGEGIPSEIVDSIFEPYFTTKLSGQGSGLGLATVHGIVDRYGGRITVESTVGSGSIFRVLLPVCEETIERGDDEISPLPHGTEAILVIDDELPVTTVSGMQLRRLGYEVDTTTSAIDALGRVRVSPTRYDLIITDLTMPGLRGDQLAAEVQEINPELPIILTSGYANALTSDSVNRPGIKAFLQKPIQTKRLARIVRKVLDERV